MCRIQVDCSSRSKRQIRTDTRKQSRYKRRNIMPDDPSSSSTSLLELRQNTTLPANQRMARSAYSNLDDTSAIASHGREPATVSDPLGVAQTPRVRNNGLIAWHGPNGSSEAEDKKAEEEKENGASVSRRSRSKSRSNNRSVSHGSKNNAGDKERGEVNSSPLAINDNVANAKGYFTDIFGNGGKQLHLKDLFVENAHRLRDTIADLSNTQRFSRTVRHHSRQDDDSKEDQNAGSVDHWNEAPQEENNPLPHRNHINTIPDPLNSHIPHAHFRSHPRTTSPSYFRYHPYNNTNHFTGATQNVMADAISPSVIGPTNIRFVTTTEREARDRQVTEALNIISQSMEPPIHNIDRYKDWILDKLRIDSLDERHQTMIYKFADFMMGMPLTIFRAFWHYVIMEIHLVYNLGLLYVTFYTTPPLMAFVVGLTLFWMKVVYELYRDIMHRDDPIYSSNVPKEMSIAAAISASMGFVLNMKAQGGQITEAWWRGGS